MCDYHIDYYSHNQSDDWDKTFKEKVSQTGCDFSCIKLMG